MKLYFVAYTARRGVNDEMEIQINPGVLIQETQESALQEPSELLGGCVVMVGQQVIRLRLPE